MKRAKPRNVFSAIFVVTVIFGLGYFVGTSYAIGDDNTAPPSSGPGVSAGESKIAEVSSIAEADEWQTEKMRVTAYCACPKCCGSYSDGVTASGHKIGRGDLFVAADKVYPFGTEMIVPGYKGGETVKVLDRGGVIRGNRLDVFFGSHEEALEWGVRHLDVKIRRQ